MISHDIKIYSSKVKDVHPSNITEEVKRRIREAFSHVLNGVSLIYKSIEDKAISITVKPNSFIFFMN
ncbi:hypothetical protein CHS0354_019812 [Potamilus streckersoni]|uniref:Uncharacterized protein n=1 Tax=Potamilus streckersoni TaxID=2493646 RepID=A0AAE0SUQ9_9BIVA|nr:hypothetical protein CHS0354_019812 [Potamilus streckersoni]